MATFKEWKRDFKRLKKWEKVSIMIGVLALVICLFIGGKFVIKNFIIGDNNTQIVVEGNNDGQICVDSSCELTNQYKIQADKNALYDISYKEYELGMKYKQEGDYEKAKEQFLKVTKLNVDASSAWYKLGYIEFYEGNLSGALQYFENALVGCDEWYLIFNDKKLSFCNSVNQAISDVYLYQQNYPESIRWLNKIEEEFIRFNPPILSCKAQRYLFNEQCDEALPLYLDFFNSTTNVEWEISNDDKLKIISDSLLGYCSCEYNLHKAYPRICKLHKPIEDIVDFSNDNWFSSLS
ncbi:hypothetical protein KY347_05415 [Candidatus Woesearchaeota archaeon]|nr:hypothetical protein [Candidatus Woesearchaeota archaeon]